ncbi:MAG: hypothetical protein JXA92_03565 [candidate division Zixibacteria bacterium]|nr:hypothetical protein [candidate division Zixibacteria bacterium]
MMMGVSRFVRSAYLIIILVMSAGLSVAAEQLTVEYTFNQPRLERVTIENTVYDRLVMNGAPNFGYIGQPALPARGTQILLPTGAVVTGVEILTGEKIALGDGYLIEPVGEPFKLSAAPEEVKLPTPDPVLYASNEPFPSTRMVSVGSQNYRGYRVLVLRLRPVEYIPASGELGYYPKITVVVTTEDAGQFSPLFRGAASDYVEMEKRVDNPELLTAYPAAKSAAANYDLLIITHSSLVSVFQELKDYHDTTGFLTEIHTLTDIGGSDPDVIRDYIRNEYINNGIRYVLIGGGDRLIPAKDLYVRSWEGETAYEEFEMPADCYFGCLDGTFNYDGDSYWGEPTDGEDGGDVDLFAEVFVGRAAVMNDVEAQRFVNKTIEYLESQDPYLEKVTLVGEQLEFTGFGEYGGYSLDELVDGSDAHGYNTVGFPTTVYDIDKLYDLTWPTNNWPQSEIANRINNGRHIVNHYGHCNFFWAMKIDKTQIPVLFSNDDVCFIYSQGCMAGQFDGYNVGGPYEEYYCWAECMNVLMDCGAFAEIMNARYGWGDWHTDGPSQRFNREFWDAVYNPGENKPQLGRANQDSKEDNVYRIDESCMRWCFYELNLFGDPTVAVKSRGSLTFSFPEGVPEQVGPNDTATVEMTVAGICGGDPLSGSGQLHYSLNGGEVQTVVMTETSGNNYEADLPNVSCEDVLEFYFSAEEAAAGRIYYPESPFNLFAVTEVDTLFEDDFETDKGWTVSGGLWARGIPTGQGGTDHRYDAPDPTSGCAGPNVFGYNLNGDYENYLSEMHLTSPPIDCSEMARVHLQFSRWLGVEAPVYDHAYVRVSNNGSNWTTVWENYACIADIEWFPMDLDISAVADSQATVYLRWTMGTADATYQLCGWNIDDVRITAYPCIPYICGDINCSDSEPDIADITRLIDFLYISHNPLCAPPAADVNGSGGDPDISDITHLINHLYIDHRDLQCP